MKAIDISKHFLSQADWLDPAQTVDGVIVGRPDREVKTILVTWISSMEALKDAVERRFDAVLTHEPTFYDHAHEREVMDRWEIGREKKRLVEENDLVVIRNHDCWDKWPRIGIPWAWGRYLELGDEPTVISRNREQHRYDIEPVTLNALAARVASKTALTGEPFVQVAGDGERMVSKVGVGTGCGCRIDLYRELGCDVSIVCDDGTAWWGELQRAADMGMPVIRANHGSSEDPGMVTLTKYINEHLDGVTAEHRPHRGYYHLIGGEWEECASGPVRRVGQIRPVRLITIPGVEMQTLLGILCMMILAAAVMAGSQPEGKQVRTATIRQGDLAVTFRDNSESPKVLSGIGSLFNVKDAPGFDAYDPDGGGASGGMNFEHVISGHADTHNAFSPRHGVYSMYELPDGKSVMWQRKSEDDPWGMDSSTKITVTGPRYLDMEFKCRATDPGKFGDRGYAILFWCNYMNDVAEVPIHFRGTTGPGGEESWIEGNAPEGPKDWNTGGTYRHLKAEDLRYDEDHNFKLNSWSYDYPRYTKPFYYGLTKQGMVYMLMFDKTWTAEDEIRFSIFKFKLKDNPRPAWDYEYVIHKVQAGREYGYRARVVWKKFVSPEDCAKEYESWVNTIRKR